MCDTEPVYPEPDWEETRRLAVLENVREVRAEARRARPRVWLRRKVEATIERFSHLTPPLSAEQVYSRIRRDVIYATQFMKKPNRQSFEERVAIEFLSESGLNATKPEHSEDRIKIDLTPDGIVVRENSFGLPSLENGASLDCMIRINENTMALGSMKYGDWTGTAQHQNHQNVQEFVQLAVRLNREGCILRIADSEYNVIFFAALDGPFYDSVRLNVTRNLVPEDYTGEFLIGSCGFIANELLSINN